MEVPFISDDDIFHIAEEFLNKYHPELTLPVPIEKIAEVGMELSILPVKSLEPTCDISGTIGRDFNTILIDESTYEKQEDRARFTIAHEIGHVMLHKDIFEEHNGSYSVEEFVKFQNNLSRENHKRLEIQAYRFAEEVLYPKEKLKEVVSQVVKNLGGVDSLLVGDIGTISREISSKFLVSERAAFNKLKREFPKIVETATLDLPF
jgi:Zn-dependent peptidase ImmA (M78 family)